MKYTGFNCIKCGHPVSDEATICPFCGDPDAGKKAVEKKKLDEWLRTQMENKIFALEKKREEERREEVKKNLYVKTIQLSKNSVGPMTFDEAEKFCKTLREDGFMDWRLPTIVELYCIAYSDRRVFF